MPVGSKLRDRPEVDGVSNLGAKNRDSVERKTIPLNHRSRRNADGTRRRIQSAKRLKGFEDN
jgi:hypothetical protein